MFFHLILMFLNIKLSLYQLESHKIACRMNLGIYNIFRQECLMMNFHRNHQILCSFDLS